MSEGQAYGDAAVEAPRARQSTRRSSWLTALPPIPVSFFSIPVGVLGLANAWKVGERIWHLPPTFGNALEIVGASSWFLLLALYADKWSRQRAAAQREARDPFQSSFVALTLISTMLVAASVLQVSRSAGAALVGVSVVAQLALGLWLFGRTWQGGHGADFPMPALYLPCVGQSFVAANCAILSGWPQVGAWLFGCGALSWLPSEAMVLVRAATRESIPPGVRPALGVQLAPPVVGGLAYLSLTTGRPDMLAHVMFGYGLYQVALMLRLSAWIRQPSFSPGYWSFSFGASALPAMAMRMVERGDSGPMVWAAPILFIGANLFIAYLAIASLRLFAKTIRDTIVR